MKYIVMEIQTAADGTVATLVTQKDTLPEAQSTYYTVLAAAAVSQVPYHSAVLLTNEGITLMSLGFDHREVANE